MKLLPCFTFCLLICYFHLISSQSSTTNKPVDKTEKQTNKPSAKPTGNTNAKAKDKNKESTKNSGGGGDHRKTKDKSKVNMKDAHSRSSTTKPKKPLNIRTPFDQILDKLSKCTSSSSESPSLVEVMQENFKELQTDEKYIPLFNAAPHTAAFLKKKKQDSSKFIVELREALSADWSNPAWKSADEIDTLFRPLKQQFVYTMMRFNCT